MLESKVITKDLYDEILRQLPGKYTPGMIPADVHKVESAPTQAPQNEKKQEFGSANSAQAPPPYSEQSSNDKIYVEALYAYRPQQPEDMELQVGDKIEVIEKLSPSWWRGTCGSRSGIFPSNYVKELGNFEKDQKQQSSAFQPPPQQMQVQQQQQPAYFSQGPQQFMTPQMQQQPQQETEHHSNTNDTLHKFGSKLGNAAIFGAGATIGSDLVNSIF